MPTDPSRATPAAPTGGAAPVTSDEYGPIKMMRVWPAERDDDTPPEATALSRALAMHDGLPDTHRPPDNTPLRNCLPGIWPTVGDLRALLAPAAPAAGGVAGVATVEEVAGLEKLRGLFSRWVDASVSEPLCSSDSVSTMQFALGAVEDEIWALARLAEPRAGAGGPSRDAGRVDAGAVREAAQAVVDFVFSTPRHLRPSVPIPLELLATLENALATAGGDGSVGDGWEDIAADAARYRHLREHCSSHYPMTHDQPAEWSISWDFQQTLPEHAFGSFDGWIDQDIARQAKEDAEDDEPAPPALQPEPAK